MLRPRKNLVQMKRSKQETAETRKRIVETAATEFRRNGIDGTGLADLMGVAGLTHGGFYRHFESKDHVVVEILRSRSRFGSRKSYFCFIQKAEA